jgi:hypothetical protein
MSLPKYTNNDLGEEDLNKAKKKILNKFKISLKDIAPDGVIPEISLNETADVFSNDKTDTATNNLIDLIKKNSEYIVGLETYVIPYEKSKKPELEIKLANRKKELDKDLKKFESSPEVDKLLYINALFNMIKLSKERLNALLPQEKKLEEEILKYTTQKQDIEEGIDEFTTKLQAITTKKVNPILKYEPFIDKEYTDDEIDKRLQYLQQQLNDYKRLTTNTNFTYRLDVKRKEYETLNDELLKHTARLNTEIQQLETLNNENEYIEALNQENIELNAADAIKFPLKQTPLKPIPMLLKGSIKQKEKTIKELQAKLEILDIEIENLVKQESKDVKDTDEYYKPNEIKLEETYLHALKRLNPFVQGFNNIQQMEKIIQEYKDKNASPEEIAKMEEELQNIITYMKQNEAAVFPGLTDGLKTAMIELNKYKETIFKNIARKNKKFGKTGFNTPEETKKIKFFENTLRIYYKEIEKIKNMLITLENKLKVVKDTIDVNKQTIEYVLEEGKKEFGAQNEDDLLKLEDGYRKVLGAVAITIIKIQNKYFQDKKKLEEDIINERSVFTVAHTKIDKDHIYEFDKLLKKVINNFKVINDEFNNIIANSNYLNSSIYDDLISSYKIFKSNYKSLYDKLYNKSGNLKLLEGQQPGTIKDPSRGRFEDMKDNIKKLFELLNIFDSNINSLSLNYNPQRTTIKQNLRGIKGAGYFINTKHYLSPKFL